ncbi:hypothetical protein ACLX1H_000473 [Fusarium chlamydosporum]
MNDNGKQNHITEIKTELLLWENEAYIDFKYLEAEDPIEWFMTKGGDRPRLLYKAELVKTLCTSATLQELMLNDPKISTRKMCLIDDRTNDGLSSRSLGDYRPLTPSQTY